MSSPDQLPERFYDNDQVLAEDGRIFRVIGNVSSSDSFIGFNLYRPDPDGTRSFRGQPYTRNRVEDPPRPYDDALEAYGVVSRDTVVEHFDALRAAQDGSASFRGTVWHDLYEGLVELFGKDSVGALGSALPGLHLNNDGRVRNDVDFFVEGLQNIPVLAAHLTKLRQRFGFTEYAPEVEAKIRRGWEQVFTNPDNSYDKVMQRRWSGMQIQLAGQTVLNTFRFRDTNVVTPLDIVARDRVIDKNVAVSGVATDAAKSNLWPRSFTLDSDRGVLPVHFLWWKFCSPVREEDEVTLRGDIVDVEGQEALRITNYKDHSIHIHS
jgi:predicted nucleotidyltransferase